MPSDDGDEEFGEPSGSDNGPTPDTTDPILVSIASSPVAQTVMSKATPLPPTIKDVVRANVSLAGLVAQMYIVQQRAVGCLSNMLHSLPLEPLLPVLPQTWNLLVEICKNHFAQQAQPGANSVLDNEVLDSTTNAMWTLCRRCYYPDEEGERK